MQFGTWLSLLLFVLAVAPGLLFDLLAERRRAGFSESAFREASRIVLASLFFTVAALALLGLTRLAVPSLLPDPRLWLLGGDDYLAKHLFLVARAVAVQGFLALLLAWLAHLLLAWWQGGDSIRPVSSWTRVFKSECPPGHDVFVRVRLGESVYLGRLAYFTPDLESAERELVLAPPMQSKLTQDRMEPLPELFQRVVLPGDSIDVLSVAYLPSNEPQTPPRTSIWSRLLRRCGPR